jgi:hypothetical protein
MAKQKFTHLYHDQNLGSDQVVIKKHLTKMKKGVIKNTTDKENNYE